MLRFGNVVKLNINEPYIKISAKLRGKFEKCIKKDIFGTHISKKTICMKNIIIINTHDKGIIITNKSRNYIGGPIETCCISLLWNMKIDVSSFIKNPVPNVEDYPIIGRKIFIQIALYLNRDRKYKDVGDFITDDETTKELSVVNESLTSISFKSLFSKLWTRIPEAEQSRVMLFMIETSGVDLSKIRKDLTKLENLIYGKQLEQWYVQFEAYRKNKPKCYLRYFPGYFTSKNFLFKDMKPIEGMLVHKDIIVDFYLNLDHVLLNLLYKGMEIQYNVSWDKVSLLYKYVELHQFNKLDEFLITISSTWSLLQDGTIREIM